MSITLMAKVFRRTFGSATRKAVAVKLADHADDYGCGIWPSAESLAAECEVSIPTVRRTLKHFVEESGLLILMKKGGSGRFSTNRYDMDLAVLEKTPLHDVAKAKQDAQNSANSSASKVITVTTLEGGLGDHCDSLGDHGDSLGDHRDSQTISKPSNNLSCAEALEKEVSDSGFDEKVQERSDPKLIEKAIEKQFKAFGPTWDTWVVSSERDARTAWFDLTDDQREAAVARADDYLAASKAAGRTLVCSLGVYLKERRWEKLPQPKEKRLPSNGALELNPFGKAWMAYRLWVFDRFKPRNKNKGGYGLAIPGGGTFYVKRDDHAAGRYPYVAWLDAGGGRLPKGHATLSYGGFTQIAKDGVEYLAWERWHFARDLPWIDPPDYVEYIWVPQKTPEGFELRNVKPVESVDEDQDFIEASR